VRNQYNASIRINKNLCMDQVLLPEFGYISSQCWGLIQLEAHTRLSIAGGGFLWSNKTACIGPAVLLQLAKNIAALDLYRR
jgi:hypothetical protein